MPVRIKPELLEKNIAIREEWNSTYHKEYAEKNIEKMPFQGNDRSKTSTHVQYIQNAQEKVIEKQTFIFGYYCIII
mgnify:CR=1 FL=1